VPEPHREPMLLIRHADQPVPLGALHRNRADQPGQRVQVEWLAERQQLQRVQHLVGQLFDAGIPQRRQLRGDPVLSLPDCLFQNTDFPSCPLLCRPLLYIPDLV
jgi:hypothetical protein